MDQVPITLDHHDKPRQAHNEHNKEKNISRLELCTKKKLKKKKSFPKKNKK